MKYNRKKLSFKEKLKNFLPWIKVFLIISILLTTAWNIYKFNTDELLKVEINWEISDEFPGSIVSLKDAINPLKIKAHQLDLHEIKYTLEQLPWVRTATVKRLFWDSIHIQITQQEVALKWKNQDCNKEDKQPLCRGYISTSGEVFTPEKLIESNNPLVVSNAKKTNGLLKDYQSYQQIIKQMPIKTFLRSDIDTLIIDPNITVILGYSNQHERLERFYKVYKQLRKKIGKAKLNKATYDMRYPKGFVFKP